MEKIKLFGKNYLLIGDVKEGGAIATKKQFENFEPSYAHLCPNGDIKKYGVVIGSVEDIKFIKTP